MADVKKVKKLVIDGEEYELGGGAGVEEVSKDYDSGQRSLKVSGVRSTSWTYTFDAIQGTGIQANIPSSVSSTDANNLGVSFNVTTDLGIGNLGSHKYTLPVGATKLIFTLSGVKKNDNSNTSCSVSASFRATFTDKYLKITG